MTALNQRINIKLKHGVTQSAHGVTLFLLVFHFEQAE